MKIEQRYELYGAQGIIHDKKKNKVLLGFRMRDRNWVIPGGLIEKNENAQQACIREMKEETGLEIKILAKLGDYYRPEWYSYGKKGDKSEVFLCEYVRGEFAPNDEISEIKWFGINNLPENVLPWHKTRINDATNFRGELFKRIENYTNKK